jgi:hypothetical protein
MPCNNNKKHVLSRQDIASRGTLAREAVCALHLEVSGANTVFFNTPSKNKWGNGGNNSNDDGSTKHYHQQQRNIHADDY